MPHSGTSPDTEESTGPDTATLADTGPAPADRDTATESADSTTNSDQGPPTDDGDTATETAPVPASDTETAPSSDSSAPEVYFDGTVDTEFALQFTPADGDQTDALQELIDRAAAHPGGGVVHIEPGTVSLQSVRLRSNVHLLVSRMTRIVATSTKAVFQLGDPPDDPVENVKIACADCTGDQRFVIDLSHLAADGHGKAISVVRAHNFWLSDFTVRDNNTTMSAVTLAPALEDSDIPSTPVVDRTVVDAPRDGVVRNAQLIHGHEGYGLVQVQAAQHILFEDLFGVNSGITLRLESGAGIALVPTPYSRELGTTTDITARNIQCTDGLGGMLLSPHTRINGSVFIDGIATDGCVFGIKFAPGFYDRSIQDPSGGSIDPTLYQKGYYEGPVVLTHVHVVAGNVAQVRPRFSRAEPVCAVYLSSIEKARLAEPDSALHQDGQWGVHYDEIPVAKGYSSCLAARNHILYRDHKKDCWDDFLAAP